MDTATKPTTVAPRARKTFFVVRVDSGESRDSYEFPPKWCKGEFVGQKGESTPSLDYYVPIPVSRIMGAVRFPNENDAYEWMESRAPEVFGFSVLRMRVEIFDY